MEKYFVKTTEDKVEINVQVPGSKSITNRALVLAALSNDICTLEGVSLCEDCQAMIDCLIELGFEITIDDERCVVTVRGEGGNIPNSNAKINVKSAGTVARFLSAMLAICGGDYVLYSSEQMKKRPMKEFLDLLVELGVQINYLEKEGHFPFEIHSSGLKDFDIEINTDTSTQYASAMLLTQIISNANITLTGKRVDGSYIKMTKKMIEDFSSNYLIEPDVSCACYFYAMALILGTKAKVRGVHLDSLQGDIKFIKLLEELGADVTDEGDGVLVDCSLVTSFEGLEVDMHDFSDQALVFAVVAAFAKTPSVIRNVGHIRHQESNRMMVIKSELEKIGATVDIEGDDIFISPGYLHGAEIETYDDHRVAMSFAMVGLKIEDIVIQNPKCCAKTFANFFNLLDEIIQK
ncbi:MAG: 3-phosphoshikimate 1-carboxyvinyltransferase [Eubacterium sp.]|nr:3-phosphoshikimate 1-carboxyvinyltransferase [Eubacterium sp.]